LLDVGAGYGDVDLMVVVAPALQQVRLEFQVDILDADSCRLLGEAYLELLTQLTAQPLKTVAQVQLSPALERVARAAKPLALPLAATFALGELPEFLDATFREAGLPVAVAEAPYHQVLASLLDPSGVFAQPGALAGVVLLRGVDLIRYKDDWSDKSLRELADEYVAALSRLSQRADAAPVLVGFLPDASDDARFRSWELQLAEGLSKLPGVVVLRSQDWSEHYPVEERFAVEADVLGHLPFSAQFLAALALTITRKVWGMRQRPLKVVAVDGDNTLWGGIAGEIGPEAVDLSGPRAVLARKLLELRAAGVLLVLVSNNDEATVRAVLARADSTLHAEHFSVISAEWDDKHVRLARAAETLSLGLDSFVFLDDNPIEIAAVRARLPQVMAITVPAGDELESFVSNLWALDVRAVTVEDHKRAGFYQDEQLRTSMRNEADDFATFVERLDLKLELAPLNSETLERSVQLTRRTNQFNLRPSHPAARALRTLSAQPGTEVWTLSVRDRFGDYGQVGVIALEPRGTTLEVLGLMLSCRVLGRGVEQRIVHWLAERAGALSCSEVKLVAEHTERNIPARRLVAALGGGRVESQLLEVTLSPERLRAYRAHVPSSETTQRTGEVDVHGY
jgi:FkbH-like protein